MKRVARVQTFLTLGVVLLGCLVVAQAQQSAPAAIVPPLIHFSGTLTDVNGKPLSGVVGVTFSLYRDQQGGAALWIETQNVQPDKSGRYSVMLGSTSSAGVPADLFASGEARWLGVQAQGQAEQPRIMLLSVPYALKAGDAATIGGLPPSAFVLATPAGKAPAAIDNSTAASSTSAPPPTTSNVTTTGGTVSAIPMYSTATDIENSIMGQTGTSAINVYGKLNLPARAQASSNAGQNSRPFTLTASAYNTVALRSVNQVFQWQAEPVANNSSIANGKLSLLFAQDTNTAKETGLFIASNGHIFFAPGQTFPGAGTITGVTAGTGLTGGGSTGAVTLNVDATKVVTGVTAGTDLTGGGTGGVLTLNLDTTKVPQLITANTFTGNQTVNGNVSATGVVTGSAFNIGSNLFAYGSYANNNAFLGFAGNATMTGVANVASGNSVLFSNTTGSFDTASGFFALFNNTTGGQNTATGSQALYNDTTGGGNTATGVNALFDDNSGGHNTADGDGALYGNTTGSQNTATGFVAGGTVDGSGLSGSNNSFLGVSSALSTGSLNNATAIGANAEVSESNALVLGSINGVNGATASIRVGIGTTAPAAALDVHGTGNFTGLVSFAPGQKFPGTGSGTITGVTAGTALTGGGTSGSVTLNLDTTQVPQLNTSNTFTGNQTVNGNLSATGLVTASAFDIGANVFAFGSFANSNAFLGFAGNSTMTGFQNTAVGQAALQNDTSGYYNTANGAYALNANTTGSNNTAFGNDALANNDVGSYNTAIGFMGGGDTCSLGSFNTFVGYATGSETGCVTNSTAIGAYTQVTQNNSLVLGSINGVYGATADTFVGIGTTAPRSKLDVDANIPGGLGPTVTLTNNGGSGQVSIDFNTYAPSTAGIYNPSAQILAQDNGHYTDNIIFLSNACCSPNNGLQPRMLLYAGGAILYGNVQISGNLSKGGGSFKIDHPLDPANKYLYHSFVESPDMMNVYNGNVTTDRRGLAIVVLPDYFESLNRDFRYQLTVIGQFAQAIVDKEISHNQFTIKTSRPGVKVSWQITGIRHDAYANAHRIQVEEDKPPQEQGHYLHPELFGAPADKAIAYRAPEPASAVDPQVGAERFQQ